MTKIPVILVVHDSADFDQVKEAAASHGLADISALPRMKTFRGLIEAERVAGLAKLPGVHSVEREREIKLPPRGSPQ
jgi:hypothetical protein